MPKNESPLLDTPARALARLHGGEPSTVTAGLWPAAAARPDHVSSKWRLSGRFCVRRTVTCCS